MSLELGDLVARIELDSAGELHITRIEEDGTETVLVCTEARLLIVERPAPGRLSIQADGLLKGRGRVELELVH